MELGTFYTNINAKVGNFKEISRKFLIHLPHLGGAAQTPYILWSRSLSCGGNWSENRFQFSAPTWFLNPCNIYRTTHFSMLENYVYSNWFTIISTHLLKHVLQIFSRRDPRCNSIAEKDEILYNACWIYRDHLTHTSECRILFFIVSNAPQRSTPNKVYARITKWMLLMI